MLAGFGQTTLNYDREECLHQRVERQAAFTPEKTAIVWNQTETSYGHLDAQPNKIASHLRSLGLKPRRSCWCMHETVAGHWLLPCWEYGRAGAAYAPLDPQYPEERLKLMLADAARKSCDHGRGLAFESSSLGGCHRLHR